MKIQISILKEITERLDGERLFNLVKQRLNDELELDFRASITEQLEEAPGGS